MVTALTRGERLTTIVGTLAATVDITAADGLTVGGAVYFSIDADMNDDRPEVSCKRVKMMTDDGRAGGQWCVRVGEDLSSETRRRC